MNGLLLASQQMKDMKSCVKFEPTQQMIKCMTKQMYEQVTDHNLQDDDLDIGLFTNC